MDSIAVKGNIVDVEPDSAAVLLAQDTLKRNEVKPLAQLRHTHLNRVRSDDGTEKKIHGLLQSLELRILRNTNDITQTCYI